MHMQYHAAYIYTTLLHPFDHHIHPYSTPQDRIPNTLKQVVDCTSIFYTFWYYILIQYILSTMNKLSSLIQIRTYKPIALGQQTHQLLKDRLKYFIPVESYTRLSYNYWFDTHRHHSVLEKMGRIAWFAEEICHHPQWRLTNNCLQINLSTHDIDNKVSLKDYILASFIELVLQGKQIDKQMFDVWNKHKHNVDELTDKKKKELPKKQGK